MFVEITVELHFSGEVCFELHSELAMCMRVEGIKVLGSEFYFNSNTGKDVAICT